MNINLRNIIMCVGNFICLLEPRLLRVMYIKAVVPEEKIILDKNQ